MAIFHINCMLRWAMRRAGVDLCWTSLQLNRDTVSDWHIDQGNVGLSAMLVLGSFEGGEFQLQSSQPVHACGSVVIFNGQEPHRSLPASGRRWSVVAFTHYLHDRAEELEAVLQGLAFPLTQSVPRPPPQGRWFLDLCAGRHCPLSLAVLRSGGACLKPVDAHPQQGGALA